MKKKLNVLLVLFLCIGLLGNVPAQKVYAETNDPIIISSVGTNDSIGISSQADIELIRNDPTANYVLTADIAMSSEFDPIASFSGVLDGAGHVISGLTITAEEGEEKVAFIIENTGTIKELGFENATITGLDTSKEYWAGVIATTNKGTISKCYVENSTVSGAYRSAGICAQNKSLIENCYAEATVSAKGEAGGLVAVNEADGSINMSYSAGTVYSSTNNTGGVCAYLNGGSTVSNCAFVSGSVNNGAGSNGGRIAGKMKGNPTPVLSNNVANASATVFGAAAEGTATDMNGLGYTAAYFEKAGVYSGQLDFDFSTVWYFDLADKRPRLRSFQGSTFTNEYQISSESDLELLRTYGDVATNRFVLMNDIQITGSFAPIESFNGTLDGNGHKISGFEYVTNSEAVSAFVKTNNGTIKNLGLASTVVHGADNKNNDSYASGLAGINNGVIEKCYVTGNLSGAHRAAGIAGQNFNLIVDCYFIGYASANGESGGICALAEDMSGIKNCYTQAAVYSKTSNTGGILAYANKGKAFINGCITLSGHIDNDGGSNINQVVGRSKGTPVLANNYASENALVQTSPVSSNDAASIKGKTVLNEDTNKSLFVNDLGWDLDTVWSYDETSGLRRPVLAGVTEELSEKFVQQITSQQDGTVADGITYSVINFTDANFNSQSMSVIRLDYLNNPNYELVVGTKNDVQPPIDDNGNYIKYADAEGHDSIKGIIPLQMSTTEEVRNKTVYAGVNGEFYTEQGPEGYMIKDGGSVINGTRISSSEKSYPFHGYFGVKNESTAQDPFVIGTYDDDWTLDYQNLNQATGGQYILTKNGEIPYYGDMVECVTSQPDYDQETYYRYKGRHPRTAIGYDGQYLYMVVVDGRQTDATGVYIEELAMVMKYLGCEESINMDGGGSSTSVIHNLSADTYDVINHPSNASTKGEEYNGKYLRSVFSSVLIVDKNSKSAAGSDPADAPVDVPVVDPYWGGDYIGGGSESISGTTSVTTSEKNDTKPAEGLKVSFDKESTDNVSAKIENKEAKLSEITEDVIKNISDNKTITIDLSGAKTDLEGFVMTKSSAENLAKAAGDSKKGIDSVEFKMSGATFAVDENALKAITKGTQGEELKIVVTDSGKSELNDSQKETVNNLNAVKSISAFIESDGTRISDFEGGSATITVPMELPKGTDPKYLHVLYVDEDGKTRRMATRCINGDIQFTTWHLSDYIVVYDESIENETGKLGPDEKLKPLEVSAEQLKAELNSALKVKQKGDAFTVKWGKVTGADGYFVYGGYCGEDDAVKIKTITSADTLSYKVKKLNGEALDTNMNFNFRVAAYKLVDGKKKIIAKSVSMHVAGDEKKEYSNVKAVTSEESAFTLEVGKKAQTKAKTVLEDKNKKPLSSVHASEFRYATDNAEVATVTSKGKITAKGKGSCTIWIYARNGSAKKIDVIVK